MASACVNRSGGISPESFPEMASACANTVRPGWINPRIISGRHFQGEDRTELDDAEPEKPKNQDPDNNAGKEFEFHLEDPVSMLPADELFADGKLVPLRLSATTRQSTVLPAASGDFRQTETNEISTTDSCLFSPKPPSCSIRWKELLGWKKLQQNTKTDHKTTAASPSSHSRSRNLKHFLQCGSNSKSTLNASIDSSLSLPLLQELDSDALSITSRLSISSSPSSRHEHDELPGLSFDSDKPINIIPNTNLSKVRIVKHRASVPPRASRNPAAPRIPECTVLPQLSISADSPRMNPSGKIVFHGLERSSSSPSSFNGGPRHKHRGMERSYSANVRVTPVLNVPVCSILGSSKSVVFGFPLFSSAQNKGHRQHHHHPSKNRTITDRA